MLAADILAEHALCPRLGQSHIDCLLVEGIPPLGLARSALGGWGFVARDRVLYDRGKFEFARYVDHPEGAVGAFILPLLDSLGEPTDLLAFRPGGPTAVWLGRAALAGEEQLDMPRGSVPLDVHDSVLSWLQAERVGIYVLDHALAANLLAGHTLRVATPEHARRLRVALARPAPPILVGEIPTRLEFAGARAA